MRIGQVRDAVSANSQPSLLVGYSRLHRHGIHGDDPVSGMSEGEYVRGGIGIFIC